MITDDLIDYGMLMPAQEECGWFDYDTVTPAGFEYADFEAPDDRPPRRSNRLRLTDRVHMGTVSDADESFVRFVRGPWPAENTFVAQFRQKVCRVYSSERGLRYLAEVGIVREAFVRHGLLRAGITALSMSIFSTAPRFDAMVEHVSPFVMHGNYVARRLEQFQGTFSVDMSREIRHIDNMFADDLGHSLANYLANTDELIRNMNALRYLETTLGDGEFMSVCEDFVGYLEDFVRLRPHSVTALSATLGSARRKIVERMSSVTDVWYAEMIAAGVVGL